MRNFLLKLTGVSLFFAVFIFTACEEGTTTTPGTDPPIVQFESGTDVITANASLSPSETFKVKISAIAGDSDLRSLTVYEDGTKVALDRVTFDHAGSANPLLVTDSDKSGFTWTVTVEAHEDGSTRTYEFVIADEASQSASLTLDITVIAGPLSIAFVEEAPYFWEDAQVDPGATFTVKIIASRGTDPLASLAVLENDAAIPDLARIKFNGSEFIENPLTLIDDEKTGIEWEVSVVAHTDGGTKKYTFEVADESGKTESVFFNVSTGIAVDSVFTAKLLKNQGGPVGTGGLDLDTGESTGTGGAGDQTYLNAEIKDEGIDTDLVPADNWRQRISGINGSVIRMPDLTKLPEGFNFDNVTYKEQIIDAFDSGLEFTSSNDSGELVSEVVASGDEFVVKLGEKYYYLTVTDIVVTDDNNDDYYQFSIKY